MRWLVFLLVACGGGTAPEPPSTAGEGMPALDPGATNLVRGEVVALAPAGPYTYVRLDGAEPETWVVVLGTPALRVGDTAAFRVYGERLGFRSARLARDFDRLLFGRPIREENT